MAHRLHDLAVARVVVHPAQTPVHIGEDPHAVELRGGERRPHRRLVGVTCGQHAAEGWEEPRKDLENPLLGDTDAKVPLNDALKQPG